MKTLKYYKKLQLDVQRAQIAYHRAIVALQKETKQFAQRADDAARAWRSKPSDQNRKKMLLARKVWTDHVKMLETLLGHLYTG